MCSYPLGCHAIAPQLIVLQAEGRQVWQILWPAFGNCSSERIFLQLPAKDAAATKSSKHRLTRPCTHHACRPTGCTVLSAACSCIIRAHLQDSQDTERCAGPFCWKRPCKEVSSKVQHGNLQQRAGQAHRQAAGDPVCREFQCLERWQGARSCPGSREDAAQAAVPQLPAAEAGHAGWRLLLGGHEQCHSRLGWAAVHRNVRRIAA